MLSKISCGLAAWRRRGGSAVRVVNSIVDGSAELGAGGIYVTQARIEVLDFSFYHTQDCAAFITLASVALPRSVVSMTSAAWHH